MPSRGSIYDRIMLSPVLSGEKAFEEIIIHGDGWYVKHGVTLYKGAKVTRIDRAARTVTAECTPCAMVGQRRHRSRLATTS
jgi:nitrite reductase (NADH) large subunit